jgi:transcriptional regulator with XRE-family HTH domain
MGGKRKPDSVIAQRVADAVPRLNAGESQQDVADALGVDRITIYRNLKKLTEKLVGEATEGRLAQLKVFELIEQSLVEGKVEPEVAREWRAIRSEISQLLGLNAPTKSITAHVATQGDGRFHRFIQAAAGLSDGQLETVLQFAAQIGREPLELPAGPPPLRLEEGTKE